MFLTNLKNNLKWPIVIRPAGKDQEFKQRSEFLESHKVKSMDDGKYVKNEGILQDYYSKERRIVNT